MHDQLANGLVEEVGTAHYIHEVLRRLNLWGPTKHLDECNRGVPPDNLTILGCIVLQLHMRSYLIFKVVTP